MTDLPDTAILNQVLPHNPFDRRRLPGVQPVAQADWLHVSDTHAAQMQARETLLRDCRDRVAWLDPSGCEAADALLDLVLEALPNGYAVGDRAVTRPDGVQVALDRADPMGTLGRLVQEDLCLMQKRGDEHVLTGAVLCFPSSWTLAEKAGRALVSIHAPVPEYDAALAPRVQRLFDGVQEGRPLMRANCLWYGSAALFHPMSENGRVRHVDPETAPFLRTERQCILRLPVPDSTVFSIHTFVVDRARALTLRAEADAAS